jgi:small subunit ribosomal protein S7e
LIDAQQTAEQKTIMRETTFVDAKELDVGGRKVILIYVPVPQLKLYRQVQV